MLAVIPLTIIPLVVYNILGFAYGGMPWANTIVTIPMASGQAWPLALGDLVILLAIVMLFFELLKAARPQPATVSNHLASTVVFIVYLVEFILVGVAADSVFFILTVIALFDVAAGFTISIRTATRDIALGHTIDGPS
ncbi:MAG: hypothetical protein WD036_11295 [Bauldia sp.]